MRIKFNDVEIGYELVNSNNMVLFADKDKKAIETFYRDKILDRNEKLFNVVLGDKGNINSYFILNEAGEIRLELDADAINTYERDFETKKELQDEEKFSVILKLKKNNQSFKTDWKNSYDEAYDEMIEIKNKFGVENFSISMVRGSVYIHDYETFKSEVELIKNATLASSSDNYSVIEKSLHKSKNFTDDEKQKYCVILKVNGSEDSFKTDWKNDYSDAHDDMVIIKNKFGHDKFDMSKIHRYWFKEENGIINDDDYKEFMEDIKPWIKNATLASSSDNYSVIEKSLNSLYPKQDENDISLDEAKDLILIECNKTNNLTTLIAGK